MTPSIRDIEDLMDQVEELGKDIQHNREDLIRQQEQFMAHVKGNEEAFKHGAELMTNIQELIYKNNVTLDTLVTKIESMVELNKIYEDAKGTARTFKRIRAAIIFLVGVPILGVALTNVYQWVTEGLDDLYNIITHNTGP